MRLVKECLSIKLFNIFRSSVKAWRILNDYSLMSALWTASALMPHFPLTTKKLKKGFTLAELLIALAILGVIAIFTIPKIITSQANGKSQAAAKETASMIAAAYRQYTLNNTLTTGTTPGVLTQYMNYVGVNTTDLIDYVPGSASRSCTNTGSFLCLKLHNGGILYTEKLTNFGGSATTNALYFLFDPDGVYSGSSGDGPSKSVSLFLYYNGRVTSGAYIPTGTASSSFTWGSTVNDPSWFQW